MLDAVVSRFRFQWFFSFLKVIDLSRSMPMNVCSFSSMFSNPVFSKGSSASTYLRSFNPEGGKMRPRLVPSVPVENTESSSISGSVRSGVLVRGMNIRSSVRVSDLGRKIAFPVRFNCVVIFFMASRFPSICASPSCFGMVRSVIMRIMRMPMRMEAKLSLRKSGVGLSSTTMPSSIRRDPMIFALMCGWCSAMCWFTV